MDKGILLRTKLSRWERGDAAKKLTYEAKNPTV